MMKSQGKYQNADSLFGQKPHIIEAQSDYTDLDADQATWLHL